MRAVEVIVLLGLVWGRFFLSTADAAPFPATPDAFLAQTPAATTQLYRIDQSGLPYAFTPIGVPVTPVYNALGFNPVDQFLYAFRNSDDNLIRIHSDGTVEPLGTPAGWVDFTTSAGTFLPNGEFVLGGGSTIVRLDVAANAVLPPGNQTITTPGGLINDWAVDPLTGRLFAVESDSNPALRLIDLALSPPTGSQIGPGCTGCGSSGASWFDAAGHFFIQINANGNVFQIDTATGIFTLVAMGPAASGNDAASNPFAAALEKSASPGTIQVSGNAAYTYKILNPGPAISSADFTDVLPAGLQYVGGSLANPFGGTVNSFGGTNILTIARLSIPAGSSLSITVQVLATTEGLKQNQAQLTYTTAGVPTTVTSDEPGNALKPDPTDLFVEPAPVPAQADLSITKEVLTAQPVAVGDPVTYRITVTNQGPADATGVKVTDLESGPFNSIVNVGGALTDADCGTLTGTQIRVLCGLPDIPSGGNAVFTYETGVTQEGTWSNLASASSAEDDPVGSNNVTPAFLMTTLPPATGDVSIQVVPDVPSVVPGEEIQYAGTITNNGPEDITNVIISNLVEGPPGVIEPPQLPPATGSCSATENSFSCLIPLLPAGSSITFDYKVTPSASGLLNNLLTAGAGGSDPNLADNSVVVEVDVSAIPAATPPTSPPSSPGPAVTGFLQGSGCSLSFGSGPPRGVVVLIPTLLVMGLLRKRVRPASKKFKPSIFTTS